MIIIEAILKINPNAVVSVSGNELDTCTIEWLEGTTPITKADIQAQFSAVEFDEAIEDFEEVQVNIWISNGKIIRIVENPFTPFRIPYQSFSYEVNPYQFFGIGVPENMDDAQSIMNGHARMAIDNLALAGNLVFDIDESALVNNQNMEVYPGKIFKRGRTKTLRKLAGRTMCLGKLRIGNKIIAR